jgi:DNA-binding MarR family transcriptional regulator
VTADQYVVLAVLAEEDDVTQKELTRLTYSDANTVTAMLSRLEEKGLVERQACDRDGRVRRVRLTKRGRSLERILQTHAAPFHSILENSLPVANRDQIANWLQQVIREMGSERPVRRGTKAATASLEGDLVPKSAGTLSVKRTRRGAR